MTHNELPAAANAHLKRAIEELRLAAKLERTPVATLERIARELEDELPPEPPSFGQRARTTAGATGLSLGRRMGRVPVLYVSAQDNDLAIGEWAASGEAPSSSVPVPSRDALRAASATLDHVASSLRRDGTSWVGDQPSFARNYGLPPTTGFEVKVEAKTDELGEAPSSGE